jgi:hypothetical protein
MHKINTMLRILFTVRSRGFGVPIVVSLLLAMAPIILLFQQNKLIAIQGQITNNQTKLMELQTLAARSEQSRQLYSDSQQLVEIISRMTAALSVYEKARNLTFRVHGRAKGDGATTDPPRFDQTVIARDYDLDLCGPNFPQSLRSLQWLEEECKSVEPNGLIEKLRSFDFENDTYGKTIVSLLYYLENISLLHRDTS